MVEGDGLLAFAGEVVIHDVEHLEEGGILGDVAGFDGDEGSGGIGGLLAPDFEVKVHGGISGAGDFEGGVPKFKKCVSS